MFDPKPISRAVGETMDHSKLITYVEETALRAMKNLESTKMNYVDVPIPEVEVIGERQLESLCLLIDNCLRRAKRMTVPIFLGSGVLLILFLLLL